MSTQPRDVHDAASANPQPKVGASALGAMGRLGLHELRSVVQAFPDSNVVQPTEMGVLGTKSAQEVVDERRRDLMSAEATGPALSEPDVQRPTVHGSSSSLEAHVANAKAAVEQGRGLEHGIEPAALERERE